MDRTSHKKAVPVNIIKKVSDKKKQRLALILKHKHIYLMLLPAAFIYLVFKYLPMYGISIAFQNFSPFLGFFKSQWVGFKHFESFFTDPYFFRLMRNTLLLGFYGIIITFPAPIVLAILLNEIRMERYKKFIQTVTYLPNFISDVIIIGLAGFMLSPSFGIAGKIFNTIGIESINFFSESTWFRALYIAIENWQGVGFGSIIFLASISGINQELYEAADIDGGGRFAKLFSVTLPCIAPTIIMLLIFRIAGIMDLQVGKILLMYNTGTYETADVIGTYVYRRGLIEANYSFGAAVGLFNSVIAMGLLVLANRISRKLTDTSLW